MNSNDFNQLIESIVQLSSEQKHKLHNWLSQDRETQDSLIHQIEANFANQDKIHCPRCSGEHIIKFGKSANNRQRYRCKSCASVFLSTTNSPFSRLRKPHAWLGYLICMSQSMSLRQSAKACGINLKTAFTWRHRFITQFKKVDKTLLSGIVEIDESLFPLNEKDNRQLNREPRQRGMRANKRGRSHVHHRIVLVARDRQANTFAYTIETSSKEKIQVAIEDRINPESILCSDGWRAYKGVAVELDIPHKALKQNKGKPTIDGVYHIQNVNSYHSRLKRWYSIFRGVADKNLNAYLAWHCVLDKLKNPSAIDMMVSQQLLIKT